MDIVTIDFETYYSKEFSLGKLTTEAYVRSPEFEVIGVGIKVNDNDPDWFSGTMEDTKKFLRSLDYSNRAILCHNTVFDGFILAHHFGIVPKFWFDTLSMARPKYNVTVGGSLKKLADHFELGQKGTEVVNALGLRREDFPPDQLQRYAAYCIQDVELTYKLFQELKQGFPVKELQLIDQTIRMFTEPTIELDDGVLTNHLDTVRLGKKKLLDDIGFRDLDDDQIKSALSSNPKFAKMLKVCGVTPPTKISPTTGKETWAFAKSDTEFQNLLEHESPFVQSLVAARLGIKSTIEETRTESLLGVAQRGRLPILLNYYGAHTGRFSGGDKMNLQNFPRGGELRRALSAPAGHVLIASDLSQIEARIVAWLAGQTDLVQAYAEGRDIYCEFASEVYGFPVTKEKHPTERFVGKMATLGLGYGMGADRFKDALAAGMGGPKVEVEHSEAKKIVTLYRNKNHHIPALWNQCQMALRDMVHGKEGWVSKFHKLLPYSPEGIALPNGMMLRYADLRSDTDGYSYVNKSHEYRKIKAGDDPARTKIYGGKLTENIVQALARIVLSEQMVDLGQRYKIAFQVHDEIVFCVPESEAEEAERVIADRMRTPPAWAMGLPVECELHVGDNYAECK